MDLKNHIEIDLLGKANKTGEAQSESYAIDDQWVTSIATKVPALDDQTGDSLALLTVNNTVFTEIISALEADNSHIVLQQNYTQGRRTNTIDIVEFGSSSMGNNIRFTTTAALNDANWQLAYTPSAQLISKLKAATTIDIYIAFAITLFIALMLMILILIKTERLIRNEAKHILSHVDKKTVMSLGIPGLLELARQLRKSHQSGIRSSRNTATSPTPVAEQQDKLHQPSAENFSNPMFQKSNMLDQGDGESDETEIEATLPQSFSGESSSSKGSSGNSSAEEIAIPPHIFRAYDIRGLAETELNDHCAYTIGRAIGSECNARDQQTVIIGYDGRLSSPRIKTAVIRGLLDSGRDIIEIGSVTTPMLYFATHTLDTQSGVMITGSHNPSEDNGIKMVIAGQTLCGEDITALRQRIDDDNFSEGSGRVIKQDIRDDYFDSIVHQLAIASPLKIVVDAGNGIAGQYAPQLLEELGCEVVRLYCDVDGSFPNHHPDPSNDENLAELCKQVEAQQADFGIALDGDGDRAGSRYCLRSDHQSRSLANAVCPGHCRQKPGH